MTSSGDRLLPHIIDERARVGCSRPFAMFLKPRDPSEGFRNCQLLANAVNRICWWLDANLAGKEEKESTFAYFGPNHLQYVIFFFTTMKVGRRVSPGASYLELCERSCRSSSLHNATLSSPIYLFLKGQTAEASSPAHPKTRSCSMCSMQCPISAKCMHLRLKESLPKILPPIIPMTWFLRPLRTII